MISSLYGEEEFLSAFVRFDIEAPIDAPKISAIRISVLGEPFAHNGFAKSTEFACPTIVDHDFLRADLQSYVGLAR